MEARAPVSLTALAGLPEELEHAPGSEAWRDSSRALHQRLRGSMSDTLSYLQRMFPRSWQDYEPRPVGYVAWVARQLATLYTEAPKIRYIGEDGAPLDDATTTRLNEIRRAAGIDAAQQATHEEMVATGNGATWVVPVVRRHEEGGQFLGVKALSVPVYCQAVEVADHPESHDERDVSTWWVRLPIRGSYDPLTGVVRYGIARITRDEAVWESAGKSLDGQQVWPSAVPGGANPIGVIPAAVVRWSEPESGYFWAFARDELLQQSRALDYGYTDLGAVMSAQGYGQWIGEGMTTEQAGEVVMGPRRIVPVPDPNAKLRVENPRPDLAGHLNGLEGYLRVGVGCQDLQPATLLRMTAITERGKHLELADRENIRKAHVREFVRSEQRIYDLIRRWYRAFGTNVFPRARVEVEYVLPELPQDPLQETQASLFKIATGLSSVVRERARMYRVPLEQARTDVINDLAETKAVLGYIPQPPGVSGAGTTAPPERPARETGDQDEEDPNA